jgi:hypothetical protein
VGGVLKREVDGLSCKQLNNPGWGVTNTKTVEQKLQEHLP